MDAVAMNNTEHSQTRLSPQERLLNDSVPFTPPPQPDPAYNRLLGHLSHRTDSRFRVNIAGTALWAVFHFAFCFLLQISELLAPLLFILGIGWIMIPHVIGMANDSLGSTGNDPQTQELIAHINRSFPTHLDMAGHTLTPHSLIMDGIGLMVLAALSATICAWLGRRL